MTPTGSELPAVTRDGDNTLENPPSTSAAKSGAVSADSPFDPDLARILDAWPALLEAIRRAILALIGSAG